MSFRKTVIPVAGLGTRFLPATKAVPKELLPLVDRPLIQFAVEEAVAAGSDEIILISATGKESILDHFRPDAGLEETLIRSGKTRLLAIVQQATGLARVDSVLQQAPLGVGHAILQAKDKVGMEPFGVSFPDDIILGKVPALEQLRRVHEEHGGLVVAVEHVPASRVDHYGVIAGEPVGASLFRVTDLVEKPKPEESPSDLAIIGRYVLPGEIFSFLESTEPGVGGEIQITDGMRAALRDFPCHAVILEGTRYDCGSKLGFLQATVEVARRDGEFGEEFSHYLEQLEPLDRLRSE